MDTQMRSEEPIGVVHPCCCGIDGPKRAVQACLLVAAPGGRVRQEQRTFAAATTALLVFCAYTHITPYLLHSHPACAIVVPS